MGKQKLDTRAIFVGKFLIGWTAGWKLQPDSRFRIGLTIYITLFKLGYLIIAKKAV